MNWDCGKNEYNTSLTKASLLQEAITLKTKNEIRGIAAMNKITRYGINATYKYPIFFYVLLFGYNMETI